MSKRSAEDTTQPEPKKAREEQPFSRGITEADVGITQYVNSDILGFAGVIKQRYTDFLVNEISMDGSVIRFTDDGLGDLKRFRKENRDREESVDKPVDKPAEEEKEAVKEEVKENKEFELSPQDTALLSEHFPAEEDITQLVAIMNNKATKHESPVVFSSKQQRTTIHQLIRSVFNSKIETKTTDSNTFLFLISHANTRKPSNRVSTKDTLDANGVENYGLGPLKPNLLFNLYKENKDTMEATGLISRMLRVPPKEVRFAGTKDRRGVTVQKCSVSRVKVERMNTLNAGLRGLKVGGFQYSDEGVKLGELKGNEFVVTIRDVVASGDESQLSDAFLKLGKDGFVNYYGMQRFGTFSISTHAIGKEILLGNWEAACLLILSDQELVIPDSKQARQVWESTKDAKQAAQLMPRRCVAESVILRTLGESQKEGAEGWKSADYFNAIMKIPRNLRIMYGHAYQSYIWNCVTSRRLELFGKVVVVGDLVLDDENSNGGTAASADLEEQAEEFQEDVRTDKYQRAKPITEEDIKSNKYSIFDVVLPTPGFDIKYPENPKIMEIYTQIMGNDGLDPLEMTRKVKEFSFSGSYRKIVSKPSNLEFCTRHYDSPTQQLLYTDLELLNLKRQGTVIEDRILEDTHNGDKLAVIVKFQLDVSSYATMLLREVMRMDTGRHGDLCDVKQ